MKNTSLYTDYDDAGLFQRWLKGDEIAFEMLYRRYATRLLNTATYKTNSKEIARELVQEVFMEFCLRRKAIESGAHLHGYLFTILRNKISNYYRRQTIEQKYQEYTRYRNGLVDHTAGKKIENKELKEKVSSAIDTLPPRCKLVFLLKWEEKLSNKEISKHLNISVNTVEQHIRKARSILRKSLGDYEFTLLFLFVLYNP